MLNSYETQSAAVDRCVCVCVLLALGAPSPWRSFVHGQTTVPAFTIFLLATKVTSFQSVVRCARHPNRRAYQGMGSHAVPCRPKLTERSEGGGGEGDV